MDSKEFNKLRMTRGGLSRCRPYRAADALILMFLMLLGMFGHPEYAYPEGSRSLYPAGYPAGGSRANLDLENTGSYVGKVTRSGFLYVYAQAGEYILLGSRNRSSGGDIYVYNPSQSFGTPGAENFNAATPGTPDFKCSTTPSNPPSYYSGGTLGTITNRAQELAGPNSADNSVPVTNGFAPCAYQAPVTGSYGVLFFAIPTGAPPADCNDTAPDGIINPPGLDYCGVSAWDVTVRASNTSTTDINGRLYTYAFIGYTGGNSRPVYSYLYYGTRDGYRYSQYLNGLDGNGYALYSNSLGFLDSGQPLYKDLRGNEALVTTLPAGVSTQTAENPTFFSDISPSGINAVEVNRVLASLNIPLEPTSPTLTNIHFIGNYSGSTTYLGTGGTFTFDASNTITYQIVISLDGVNFDPANVNNKTLTGLAPGGSNTVVWDGTNNSGTNFPTGGPYFFQVFGRNGEVHFPIIDAENNYYGGPVITRLNGLGAPNTTVYYDDRGYGLSSGVVIGTLNGLLCPTATPPQPNPAYNLVGIDSTTGYRTWGVTAGTDNTNADCTSTNAWGDAKAVNLWTYYSTTPTTQTLSIIAVAIDAATEVTGPTTTTVGSTVQGTFSFANNGTSTAPGLAYTMSLSPGLGTVTFGNLPTGATAVYNNTTGVVTLTGFPATLAAGAAVTGATAGAPMTYSYTAPASSPVTVSTGITTTGTDGFPANNNDSVTTEVETTGANPTVDIQTTVNVTSVAAPGATVSGNIQFANYGANSAAGVTYSAIIGNSSFHPAFITFTNVPAGVTPSYNNSTGAITFTGLPTTFAGSEIFNIGFNYTAPASGTIPVTSSVTTSSTDINLANNNASANTIIGPNLTLSKSHTGNFYQGQNGAQYMLTVNNVGGATDGVTTYTVTDTLPVGLTYVSATGTGWSCGAVGQVVTCTSTTSIAAGGSGNPITLTVNVSNNAGSPLLNTAVVSGGGDTNTSNNSVCDPTTVATPDLTVSKNHSGNFYRSQTGAQYTITVNNIGSAATFGTITASDTLPAGLTYVSATGTGWSCGAVGQVVTCTSTTSIAAGGSGNPITLTVNVSAAAGNPLTNSVTVSGGGETNTTNDTANDSTTVVAGTWDLAMAKSHAGNFAQGQTGAQYTLTVSNVGTVTKPNGTTVTVTDTLPSGLTATNIAGAGWTCTLATLTCTRTNALAAGASYPNITLTVNVATTAPSPQVNSVNVTAAGEAYTGNNTATDSTTINQVPDLTVTKSHTGNFYRSQTGAQYTITVSNSGGATTTGTITATDTLPAGLTYVSGTGTGWSCGAVGQVVTCTSTTPIAAGSSGNPITLTVNVSAAAGSPLVNSVTVSGGGETNTGNDTGTDSTTVTATAPDLTVTKSHVGNFSQGQASAQYTITVNNIGNAATTGTITATDTLPTGLIYVSATGTGWTCGASGQVVTCTSVTVINAASSGNPITLTVNVSSNAGSPLVNSVTVSGGGETYTANDTATDSTIINTSPDLTITKTDNGPFYLGGSGFLYTITVTNSGTAPVSNTATVTVTDTLPSGVTATAISGTNWTCTLATLTCSRSNALAALAAGSSYPAITLTVSVSNTAPYSLTNTANVSLSGQVEANVNNNTAQDTTSVLPTLVTLSSFSAYNEKGQLVVQWTTSSEVDAVGFYLYRLDKSGGKYTRINRHLLPALITSLKGGTYSLIDTGASVDGTYTYVLVERQGKGSKLTYGPFTVGAGQETIVGTSKGLETMHPELFADCNGAQCADRHGKNAAAIVSSYDNEGTLVVTNNKSGLTEETDADLYSDYVRKPKQVSEKERVRLDNGNKIAKAYKIARAALKGNRVKISLNSDGLYYLDAVTISNILGKSPNGIMRMISDNELALTNKGEAVAYLPAKGNAGIYFYGEEIESQYTGDNIYWLGRGKGLRMQSLLGAAPSSTGGNGTFTEQLHVEQNKYFISNLSPDPQADHWVWDWILYFPFSYPDYDTRTYTVHVDGAAAVASTATLVVNLDGYTDDPTVNPDQHVAVTLNGALLAPTVPNSDRWDGQTPHSVEYAIDQNTGLLKDGDNTLVVQGVGDTGAEVSGFYIDSFDLTYQRLYRAENNQLIFGPGNDPLVTVHGFNDPNILVFDISSPSTPRLITATKIGSSAGNYSVTLSPGTPDSIYLAASSSAAQTGTDAKAEILSNLFSTQNRADYLVIVPGALKSAAQPLADYRQSKGLETMVVDLENIMDEFNYGISSPEAIRSFLQYAYQHWTKAPRYVVLVGEGTYDYKDYLGFGDNLLPTLLASTPQGVYASDNLFGDVNGGHVPVMAIGRIPVVTPAELNTVINKIKAYEASSGNCILFLAGVPDEAGDFPLDSDYIATLVPPGYVEQKVYLTQFPTVSSAQASLLNELNGKDCGNVILVNYIGHGDFECIGRNSLSDEGLVCSSDLGTTMNWSALPVWTAITCVAGDFAEPGSDSLGQSLILSNSAAAVAFWGSTGLSYNDLSKVLDEGFFRTKSLTGTKGAVLGDLLLGAMTWYNSKSLPLYEIDLHTLQGDPALRLR